MAYDGIKTRFLSTMRPLANDKGVIVIRLNACGSKYCSRCPHGPYYYLRTKTGRKRHDHYLGQETSEIVQEYLGKRFAEQAASR